ncbi:ANTAR domain-containing protein [Arthrobacter crusticola]|uniref:ANTAR domain-containing protein n=1 Tax=Arthrobacter crusticola TaxID=2547960 RepID=A0A4R5U2R3_9MICC|nr:GAF and ANTAR domain-containing protein [Arthrobacter crusticola]TDK27959.1 ANTAR domain-containing protein [Arthrobacter crusticola]
MANPEAALESERRFSALLDTVVLESTDVLDFLTDLAVLAVKQLSPAGMPLESSTTLIRPRKAGTVASSSPRAARMDEFQYRVGNGPCLEAARTRRTVYVGDLERDTRWPEYREATAGSGIRSVLGVPIALDGEAAASLNLYSALPDGFDEQAREAAGSFARQASRTLRLAVRIAALTDTAQNLRAAMQSRTTINLAAGIVMAQNGCSHEAAIEILMKASNIRNTKLREVAAAVVASAAEKGR